MVLPERSQERLCKLISHHHAADQVVEADRKIKERCIGVVTRKKNPSLHEESNLRPFDSASQQRLFRWAAENSLESEAIK